MPGMLGDEGDRLERLALLPHPRGMLASEGRGSVMSPGVDWTDWIAPQWLAELAAAVQAPKRAAMGEEMDPRDALGVALSSMGGGMFTGRGAGAGMNVFHTGPKRVTTVDPAKLQQRDHGFFGKGFYTSELPQYGYGRVPSRFDLPDELILNAGRHPNRNPELAQKVADWHYQKGFAAAKARNKVDQLTWEADQIKTDHLAYVRAVDRYAEAHGIKAVKYGSEEIVVKDPSVLTPLPFKDTRDVSGPINYLKKLQR